MSEVVLNRRIAFFLPNLHGGGAERVVINLLKGMSAKNVSIDLVLATAEGPYLEQVPKQVRIVNLAAGRVAKAILPLARYLRQEKPDAVLSHMNHANAAAAISRELAQFNTRLILVEHDTLSVTKSKLLRAKFVTYLLRYLYPRADIVVGVSKGVALDLENYLGIAEEKVKVIYNPVVDQKLIDKAKAPLAHSWFQEGAPPVFLAVGRLTEQKDFLTLLEAFAIVRRQQLARLIVLGEGESRGELEAKLAELEISEDVSLPGFVDNPYAYMSRANAFVLSSRWEALPTVLIEAMACGCPVISTDCPTGPNEILDAGKYGSLVTVGDATALSNAMLQVLQSPKNRDVLIQRAMYFSIDRIVPQYLAMLGCTQAE